MTEFFISFQDRNMDMRSLEHCLNDITNTPGVQSDLKGEFPFFLLSVIAFSAKKHERFNVEPVNYDPFSRKLKSSLKSVYKRLNQTFHSDAITN
jgi:hypothetical protein